MGKSSAETVREIEATRERLDAEIQELEHRLPPPARWAKRLAGVAVGGGVAGSAFWFAVKRLRRTRKEKKEKKAKQEAVNAVVQVIPERWAETVSAALEDGTWKAWAGGIAALWALFRLADIRQQRRTNRLLMMRTATL